MTPLYAFNRLVIQSQLIDEKLLYLSLNHVKPILDESPLHPGETMLLFLCDTKAIALYLARKLTALIKAAKAIAPWIVEVRIEVSETKIESIERKVYL